MVSLLTLIAVAHTLLPWQVLPAAPVRRNPAGYIKTKQPARLAGLEVSKQATRTMPAQSLSGSAMFVRNPFFQAQTREPGGPA